MPKPSGTSRAPHPHPPAGTSVRRTARRLLRPGLAWRAARATWVGACVFVLAVGAPMGAQARKAVDLIGHRLVLPAEVQRIGTPGISMASLLVVLGGPAKLVAATPEVRDNPWLRRIAPALAQVPVPFTRPVGVNTESLLAVRPELVMLWLGNAPTAARIEALGIPVFTLGYTTPDEMRQTVRLLGRALGPAEAERAEMFVRYYDGNLARVAKGLAGLAPGERPRVYYASLDALQTEGGASMIDAWITHAGGVNTAARAGLKGDGHVQLEDVLAWNPEIIVTLDAAQREAILADARWQRVDAVRHQRVFVNPRGVNAWCTRATEAALQVLWAAKTFHPKRFATLDLAAETRRFYRLFYRYELDDDEVARVLGGLPPPAR